MNLLDSLYARVEEELEDIINKDVWYPICAETIFYLIKTLKNIKEIKVMGE